MLGVVVVVPFWFLFLAPRSLGGPLTVVSVYGASMEPTLHAGDLSILRTADRYEVGDIVAFDIPEGGTVIHRIIDVSPDGYRFQGDNRGTPDQWVLDERVMRGRQVLAIPSGADALARLRRPELIGGLVAAMVVVAGLRR